MIKFDEFLKAMNTKVASVEDSMKSMAEESPIQMAEESVDVDMVCEMQESVKVESVEEPLIQATVDVGKVCEMQEPVRVEPIEEPLIQAIKEVSDVDRARAEKQAVSDEVEVVKVVKKEVVEEVDAVKVAKKEVADEVKVVEEKKIPISNLEDGEFPEEPGWSLLGRKVEVATSTAKGVRRLVDNEIGHFNFPLPTSSYKFPWIVRISTKLSGEVGRLLMEGAKIVIPLVQSGRVKVRGRCIATPYNLQMMQEIMLLVR